MSSLSGKSNRYAVSIRFNLAQRETLRNMCTFWNLSEKDVLKLAFEQLATSTDQINNKLRAEQETKNEEETKYADSSGNPIDGDKLSEAAASATDTGTAA